MHTSVVEAPHPPVAILWVVAGGFCLSAGGGVIMGRKPRGGYTATIKYVPTPDAVERYARALEILLRAKKRLEARKAQEGGESSEQ